MKILLINYEYPPLGGGGGIEAQDLAEQLAKTHEVTVLTTGFHNLPHKETRNGVKIYRVPVFGRTDLPTASTVSLVSFFPFALVYGLFLVPRIKPNVINAHFAIPSGLPAAFLAKIYRIPFVLTLIGGDIYDPSKGISPHRHAILRWTIRRIMRCADKITAISHDTKERAIRYYQAPEGIEVIPLGLVPPKDLVAEASVKEVSDKINFVSIGRLVARKGYFDLFRAFAEMEKKNAVLHIIGDGPLLPELRTEIKNLGVEERIVMHGRATEEGKYNILKMSDIYVSASHHEGFGICFLEAMYTGLPIITTNIGGQTDFLVPGRNAILVNVGDINKLTKAMDQLVMDAEMRKNIGEVNKKDVENFLIENTTKRYEIIFQELNAH
ncbi:MAG: glycosyltransferase [bacterium]|nr:glycosyltransferase [bacterium]